VNFTREPLIETVITAKEGYKLVVRNSKGEGQEEFFVDAVEVVSFGNASFFRSLEKPKCFLAPVNDYEILEVRESRMVLKTSGIERGIKIAGGREAPLKVAKEETPVQEAEATALVEQRVDKRRERRRSRKRRGKSEQEEESLEAPVFSFLAEELHVVEAPVGEVEEKKVEKHSLIPPPATLISESIRSKTPSSEEHLFEKKERRPLIPPPPLPPRVELEPDTDGEDDELPF
jgi:hypothetical protein